MAYMPHDDQGKNRKLALPYHGPFRILEVLPNCLVIKPVDRPDEPAIKVNMDRVTQCPRELPDVSWLGHKQRKRRGAKKEKQPQTKETNHPGTHSGNESTRTCSKETKPPET